MKNGKINKINKEKNKIYYSKDLELCDCDYCKNYYKKIKNTYKEVSKYLENLGIDIEKPFELSYSKTSDKNMEYISCQYIVFGYVDENFNQKIKDVKFQKTNFHPTTNIKEEHFVLEFGPIYLSK